MQNLQNNALFEPRLIDNIIGYAQNIHPYVRNIEQRFRSIGTSPYFTDDGIGLEDAIDAIIVTDVLRLEFLRLYYSQGIDIKLEIICHNRKVYVYVTDKVFLESKGSGHTFSLIVNNVDSFVQYIRPLYIRKNVSIENVHMFEQNEDDIMIDKTLCSLVSLFYPFETIFMYRVDNNNNIGMNLIVPALYSFDTKWIEFMYHIIYENTCTVQVGVDPSNALILSIQIDDDTHAHFVITPSNEVY